MNRDNRMEIEGELDLVLIHAIVTTESRPHIHNHRFMTTDSKRVRERYLFYESRGGANATATSRHSWSFYTTPSIGNTVHVCLLESRRKHVGGNEGASYIVDTGRDARRANEFELIARLHAIRASRTPASTCAYLRFAVHLCGIAAVHEY